MSNPTLQFQVQIDRIKPSTASPPGPPDVENKRVWLALKITTYWDGLESDLSNEAEKFSCDALLPWLWEPPSGRVTDGPVGSWDPYKPESWKIWQVEVPSDWEKMLNEGKDAQSIFGTPKRVQASEIELEVPERPSQLSTKLRDMLFAEKATGQEEGYLRAAVRAITNPSQRFEPASLGKIAEDNPAPTVPAFIERLSVSPHPLPVLSRVHGLLEVNLTDAPNQNTIFLAAPELALRRERTSVPLRVDQVIDGQVIEKQPDWMGNSSRDAKLWHLKLHNMDAGGAAFEPEVQIQGSHRLADLSVVSTLSLFDQWVRVSKDKEIDTLSSAQDAATLPQRLSDVIDPLLRLRSVLGTTLRTWIEKVPSERESRTVELATKAEQLCQALNFVACQVLWPRLDAVGRFECPLVERLSTEESLALLKEHLRTSSNLHLDNPSVAQPNDASTLKAALRVSYQVYSKCQSNALTDRLLPFTPTVLERALVVSNLKDRAESADGLDSDFDDEAVLNRLWSSPGLLAEPISNHLGAGADTATIRSFELVDGPAGEITLHSVSSSSALEIKPGSSAALSDTAIRPDCSLVYGAPFIEGLVSGREIWSTSNPSLGSDSSGKLSTRLGRAMKSLVGSSKTSVESDSSLYGQYYVALTTGSEPLLPESSPYRDLMSMLLLAMAEEAGALAEQLISDIHPGDRITSIPLPLTLAVDQLQTFPRTIDYWARLSGYGLLLARSGGGPSSQRFHSLNAATLHLGKTDDSSVPRIPEVPFSLGAPLEWRRRSDGDDWRDTSFVDPVSYAPSDQVGISDAIAEYANSWISTSMPGDPSLNAEPEQGTNSRTASSEALIRFGPPRPTGSVKLPALSFGYQYTMAAHLIACGGILAPDIRSPTNPYIFRSDDNENHHSPPKDAQKALTYKRTVAISSPTISIADAVRSMRGIEIPLLADELPQRTPARVLPTFLDESHIGNVWRWNRDPSTGNPEVDWNLASSNELHFEAVVTPLVDQTCEIIIHLESAKAISIQDGLRFELRPLQRDHKEIWLRVTLCLDNSQDQITLKASSKDRSIHEFADPNWNPDPDTEIVKNFPLSADQLVAPILIISAINTESCVAIEPVRVVQSPNGLSAQIIGSIPAPVERKDKSLKASTLLISTIDSRLCLPPFNRQPNSEYTQVTVHWPSVDRHTWERWVNAELFNGNPGSSLDPLVLRQALNTVQVESSSTTTLPDPAVTGVWFELWEIYPKLEPVSDGLFLTSKPADLVELKLIEFKVLLEVANPGQSPSVAIGENQLIVVTCPGDTSTTSIFELRVFSAICPQAQTFGQLPTTDRLGRAVAELFSPIPPPLIPSDQQELKNWLIGPAARLPIEIASTPERAPIERDLMDVSDLLKLVVESNGRHLAQVRMPRDLQINAIARLRRFQSITLLPQRWGWRGHPILPNASNPKLLASAFSEPGENRKPFDSDDAFLDWSDDDLNTLRSSALRPYHFLKPNSDEPMPLVLERDLDWRGGWQLWRFRLTLRSRYAALYKPQYSSKSELIFPNGLDWLEYDLLDSHNSRQPSVPSLAILLPLTEAFQDGGTIPPILALFIGPMHAEHHFGDGIAVLVETARHGQQSFQEFGPDPIRTVPTDLNGSVTPLRLDGPIGYGFDKDVTNPTFGHSGFLITPVTATIAPWSFIKLSFLRFENPLGLAEATFARGTQPWQLNGIVKGKDNETNPNFQPIQYEGLVVLLYGSQLWNRERSLIIQAASDHDSNAPGSRRFRLHFIHKDDGASLLLRCESLTYEKTASGVNEVTAQEGIHHFPQNVSPSLITIRLIVAGSGGAGRVLIQAWIDPSPSEPSSDQQPLHCNTWLALFHLRLASLHDPMGVESVRPAPTLRVFDPNDGQFANSLSAFPVRLSAPTQPVWCQFTTASSQYTISMASSSDSFLATIEQLEGKCSQLIADRKVEFWKSMRFSFNGSTIQIHEPMNPIAPNAQVTERVLVVFTEWISTQDLRGGREGQIEQPILIDFLALNSNNESCLEVAVVDNHFPLWSNELDGTGRNAWPKPARPANIRLMRVLLSSAAGKTDFSNLWDLFGEKPGQLDEDFMDNPPDAGGVLLSISRPTPWKIQSAIR